ncbi:Cna B-type domain-containing protein, partial [Aristaeella lactis]
MKRTAQRIISLLASVMMVFSSVPITALADAEITYQNGLPVSIAEGALTPQQILGPAVEYGVVANKYKQSGHTETNFAVKHFEINNSQSIEIMGSGSNPIPFYIGELDNNSYFWNGEATNVTFDVFINKNQSSKGKTDSNANVRCSRDNPPTNVYPRETSDINAYVDTLISYPVKMSQLMSQKSTYTPTFENNSKTIDLTGPAFSAAKNATIYVNCANMKNIMSQDGWEIIKYEGQTIVFNMPDGGNYDIKKFKVTVKNEGGGTVINGLESRTIEKNGNPSHNGNVEKYILNHIVFNAPNASSLSIDTAAGIFLAPNATVNQNNGAGAGWVMTKKGFNSTAEWHYYFKERHYHANSEKEVNISKAFTYQDGTKLPPDVANKQFTFRMDEVDGNTFQIKNGNNTYRATVIGKAGETIKFPKFNVSNKDFRCKENGEIEGNNQKIYKYYVIQEVADSDAEIVTDAKKIYVKLEAHGHDKDQIDLKLWYSEDHQNWNNEVGEDGNVGTFNNYKKQYTDLEVQKKWQRAEYKNGKITYVDTTGEHTADSVEVKLIAVKSLLQQGHGEQPTDQPTEFDTDEPATTPTPPPKPTPVPTYTLRFVSSQNNLSVEYKYKGGTTVEFWFDNGNQWWHPYEGIKLSGAVNGTIGNGGDHFSVTMDSNKTIKLTDTSNSNWGNVVTNSLQLSPAPNGESSSIKNLDTKQNRTALDPRFFIAAAGFTDISYTPTNTVGPIQSGLKSVSEITGGKEYTVVDTQRLSKSNNWKYKWENLPKHLYETDGSIYNLTYYIVETSAIGAASNSYSGNGTNKVTITNTEEETSATVRKIWDDSDNNDGKRPGSLTVDLMNGTTVVATVTLNAANNWTATVEHLAKYNNGQLISYSWRENNVPAGYTLTGNSTEGTITSLTNTHNLEKTEVSVKKVWDDANDQDGYRPESLTVTLSNGQEVVLNEENGWEAKISNLPKYSNGSLINYTWTEKNLPDEYTLTNTDKQGTITSLTNSHTPEETQVKVNKIWEDDEDQDGYRPEEVIVKLLADGVDTGKTAKLDESNCWSYTFTGLQKKKDGIEIVYTVAEDPVANYTSSISPVAGEEGHFEYDVTNSHTSEETELTVTKVWDDANDQDGYRPESVTVNLLANGKKIKSVTLDESNKWTYTWHKLPKKEKGKNIKYTVEEEPVEHYETEISINKGKNGNFEYDVTNTHVPENTEVSVKKVWEDAGNQDGIRPDKVTVRLLADGTEKEAVELNEGNGWAYSWSELDKKAGGKDIAYTVTEDEVTGYKATITSDGEGTFSYTVTNAHTPAKTEATVKKVWNDNEDQDAIRPASLTVVLSNGTEVTLDKDNNWSATVKDLPKYAGGQLISYTWTEKDVPAGYTLTGNSANGTVTTLTNTHTTEETEVEVTKEWKDYDNVFGYRPDEVTVNLLADGAKVGSVTLNEENHWTYTWTKLAKKNKGKNITYMVTEEPVANYSARISQKKDGSFVFTVTNTLITTNISGEKVWNLKGNNELLPEEITVYIKDGTTTVDTLTVKAGEDGKWSFTSKDLPKYRADG